MGFGEAKGGDALALEPAQDELLLLFLGAEFLEHRDEGEVADNRMLILQIVVQAQALCCEMLADHRHPQVGAILAAIFLRRGKAPVPGGIGAALRLAQQLFPVVARQAAIVEIGARPFAAMVEKADIVVRLFERLDLLRDERVELGEIGGQLRRKREIHGCILRLSFGCTMDGFTLPASP